MKRVPRSTIHRILGALVALLFLLVGRFAWGLPFEAESTLPLTDDVRELDGKWEYRLGDSERRPGQAPDWAIQDPAKGWQRLASPSRLPDTSKSEGFVWLKVPLPAGSWESPSLLIESADVLLEVYAGGKLLFSNESIDKGRKAPLLPRTWHVVSLPSSAVDKPLLLRVHKNPSAIGLGRVFVGSKHLHHNRILSASMARLVLGSIAILLGLFSIALSFTRGAQISVRPFGLFALTAGLYMFVSAPMRRQWMAAPGFWEAAEFAVLFLVPAGISAYLEKVVEGKLSTYSRRAWQLHVGFFLLAVLAAVPDFLPMRRIQPVFLLLASTTLFSLTGLILRDVWKQGLEKRIAVGTIGVVMFTAFVDVVKGLFVTPTLSPSPPLAHVGLFVGILALAFLLVQRTTREFARVSGARDLLAKAFQGSLEIVRQNETLLAVCKASEAIVREIDVETICNVTLYIRNWDGSDEDPIFTQAVIVSQGRLAENPKVSPLKQKHEAAAEVMLGRPTAVVTSSRLLVVPLVVAGRRWGFLTFDHYGHTSLTPSDDHFTRLMAGTLTQVLENVEFLLESRSRAQGEVEGEATSALQRLLLPPLVQVPSAQVATNYQAARKSGGDWFGYYHHDKRNQVDFFIGDVTGHGVTSALLAGVASGAVYSIEAAYAADGAFCNASDEERLLHMARIVNRVVFEAGKEKLFMAMLFLSINLETGEGIFLNSGHQPFYHIQSASNKTTSVMPNPGNTLGFSLSPNFSVQKFQLQPGDLLFLYTAGLFGNHGPASKKLGVRKVKTLLEKSRDPIELQGLVLDAAREIWQNQAAEDDVTTVVFKWLGPVRGATDDPNATTQEILSPVSRSA